MRSRLDYICSEEKITTGPGGIDSLIDLGEGDMRRTLNLLQSTCMSAGEVTEDAVYATAGKPLPKEIEKCAEWLLNDPLPVAFKSEI